MPSPTLHRATRGARKPHICFLAPTTWPVLSGSIDVKVVGGAEVQQSLIAPALARRGYRVSMVSLDYGQPDRSEVAGVTIHNMHRPDEGIPGLRFLHPRLTSLWRVLKQVDADVYYQRTAAAYTGFLAHFCRRHGRKSIYAGASDVDFLPGQEDIRFARDKRIFEWGVRRVDRVITQNTVQKSQLFEHYGLEGPVIPSCYMAPQGARADRGGYVLWTASVRASKRAELALEIARQLPGYRFVIVGGPDRDRKSLQYYASLSNEAKALPNVEMKGFVPFAEAERLFDGARVVLNTSLYEGFPNTFLQAWARAIPNVAFIDTGSRTKGGEPVYDIARDVSDAIHKVDRLMRDDIHWREASSRVFAHYRDNHAIEAIIDRYEHEIAGLTGSA
ncbi:MAG TPA: glycosyltransferase family 4 protein [Usitatibacter sp.]